MIRIVVNIVMSPVCEEVTDASTVSKVTFNTGEIRYFTDVSHVDWQTDAFLFGREITAQEYTAMKS